MATVNPFDLLGDDDSGDVSQLIAAQQQKAPASAPAPAAAKKAPAQAQPPKQPAKLPSKPLPPSQAVREANSGGPRGGDRGAGRGGGRGRGYVRESTDENAFGNNGYPSRNKVSEDGEDRKPSERRPYGGAHGGGGFRGGRRGGFSNGDAEEGERPRRVYDRRSGTGRGTEFKREGSGRGNWGTPTDEIAPEIEEPVIEGEKNVVDEKQSGQENVGDANKDSLAPEQEEKEEEPEEKEMTLEEYEKVLEEKRKALLAHKNEERKVDLDKEFESMQLLSNKKNDEEVFIKLGSDKDKRKEAAEKAKKSVSINEFLKPAEGEYYRGGRGRGRGRGRGGYAGNNTNNVQAPSIEDAGHFPSLGGK